jgi:hypothetical protein
MFCVFEDNKDAAKRGIKYSQASESESVLSRVEIVRCTDPKVKQRSPIKCLASTDALGGT